MNSRVTYSPCPESSQSSPQGSPSKFSGTKSKSNVQDQKSNAKRSATAKAKATWKAAPVPLLMQDSNASTNATF